jgi:hypothetical protein
VIWADRVIPDRLQIKVWKTAAWLFDLMNDPAPDVGVSIIKDVLAKQAYRSEICWLEISSEVQ